MGLGDEFVDSVGAFRPDETEQGSGMDDRFWWDFPVKTGDIEAFAPPLRSGPYVLGFVTTCRSSGRGREKIARQWDTG
jgi:hypothetical protein